MCGLLTAVVVACLAGPTTAPTQAQPAGPELHVSDLHNVHQITTKLYCGSGPETEAHFKALAEMGVKTVVSVDGAKPSVELARKFGLRYVHLPFGYDGIPRSRELEIARAVRDLPGPIYLHCHHGKHRGPAAAMIAAEATAAWSPQRAVLALHQLGTGMQYQGLYAAVQQFSANANELDHADATFPPAAKLTDLADIMVQIDQRWDHLLSAQKAGWSMPKDHPDIDPAHEALMLKELLREAHRPGGPAKDRGPEFADRLTVAEQVADELETALRSQKYSAANDISNKLQQSCTSCHAKYRDSR